MSGKKIEVMNQNISCPLFSNCMIHKKKNRNLSIRKMGNLLPLKLLELLELMTYKTAIRLKGNTLTTIACTLLACMGGELCQI